MAVVESGGDPDAYNPSEGAYGPLQIRQCAVTDINRACGTNYRLKDFRSISLSRWAVVRYAIIYNWDKSPEAIARCWNGGPNGPRKPSTKMYWRRVKRLMKIEMVQQRN